ncbi:YqzL family protein [Gorillibacterium sp. CAU 1737]|uniref:YqzL family protein n=1 Tax=Gorillibacterium sp. CAU 1737 TaxID=3140362 RepID=UPI00325FF924
MMKEFYWQYFHNTGNVEAYLLYKTDDGQEEMPEEQAELASLSPESEPYLG